MQKNLVIVESPAKAKTILKYLNGKFSVESSIGHIRSIAKKADKTGQPIDIANGFVARYEIDPEKKKVVDDLKKAVKNSSAVWLATDGDREGEAIAWHLCDVLKLDPNTTRRIVFHEITELAINEALKHPRIINMSLVEAQQARQILDRIVGFELSLVVWHKVPGGKSAGRVQSPAVKLIVEREREIQEFQSQASFVVSAEFAAGENVFKADLAKAFNSQEQARQLLNDLIGATYTVKSTQKNPGVRNPSAPFTTSTLQQEANSRLGYSAKLTMSAAQKLYQSGKITYMRTDSTTLSDQAINSTRAYILSEFGTPYYQKRLFKTNVINAQEAHEAIRPTNIYLDHASDDNYEQKIYELIRSRTLASQMTPAKIEKTVIDIANSNNPEQFVAKGEIVVFDGFLKVYKSSKKDSLLPLLIQGDALKANSIIAKQTFKRPPARYTEGTLVKKLEELGIGRPSTYATIISTIQTRQYVNKGTSDGSEVDIKLIKLINSSLTEETIKEKTGSDKGRLIPTSIGFIISDFLTEYFNRIVDYGFTAQIEKEFDLISNGKLDKATMLKNFYTPFHALIEASDEIKRSNVAKMRLVGKDPKTNRPIYARYGRFGPMFQLGDTESETIKPVFAPIPKGATIETVTLDQALMALSLPRLVGKSNDGRPMTANIGRYGPYIQVGEGSHRKLFSIANKDPFTITEAQAKEVIQQKIDQESANTIKIFKDEKIKIVKGRFGPYVTDGTKNVKIPKNEEPELITLAKAISILNMKSKRQKYRPPNQQKTTN